MLLSLCRCPVCEFPPDREAFPFCEDCLGSLVRCPPACADCGSLGCSPERCLGPAPTNPITRYHARYLAVGAGYTALRRWKAIQGPLTDQRILIPDQALLEELSDFRGFRVVPVPQRLHRALELGGSPALRIARWVARLSHATAVGDALEGTQRRLRQAELGLDARLRTGSRFRVRPHRRSWIRGQRILLVDDLITTGRTVRHAAEALKEAGAGEIRALALGFRPRIRQSVGA